MRTLQRIVSNELQNQFLTLIFNALLGQKGSRDIIELVTSSSQLVYSPNETPNEIPVTVVNDFT